MMQRRIENERVRVREREREREGEREIIKIFFKKIKKSITKSRHL